MQTAEARGEGRGEGEGGREQGPFRAPRNRLGRWLRKSAWSIDRLVGWLGRGAYVCMCVPRPPCALLA